MPAAANVHPHGSGSARAAVDAQLVELSGKAASYSLRDLRRGVWFPALLDHALERYGKGVDAGYFETRYPGLDREAIVDRRIDRAKQYAALSGGSLTSPLMIAIGAASFAADLFFLTQLQLRITYDLGVLYEHRIDLEDPDDVLLLIRMACGARAGDELRKAAGELTPEAVRRGLPVVGRCLLQRNIIKIAIPGVVLPLSSGLNYFYAGRTAATARQVFRDRVFLEEATAGLMDDLDHAATLLLLRVIRLIIRADGKVSTEEAMLLDSVMKVAAEEEVADPSGLEEFRRTIDRDEETVLEELASAPRDLHSHVYEAACLATAMDRRVRRREEKQLRRIADVCQLVYDRQHVGRLIERMSG